MTSEAQETLNDETFKALGRFIVRFSGVIHSLEQGTIFLLGIKGSTLLFEAALADRTASPIISAFFSVFFEKWGKLVTPGDKQIMIGLRRELDALVKTRNRLMHDAWMSKTIGGEPGPHALSRVRVRTHGTGANYEIVSYDPNDIEHIASDAHRLSGIINSIVWHQCNGQTGPELEARFHFAEGKLSRQPDKTKDIGEID